MSSTIVLDLVGVIQPICLLKCRNALDELGPGEIMEVHVQDPMVVEDMKKIIQESGDQVLEVIEEEDHFRVVIRKKV